MNIIEHPQTGHALCRKWLNAGRNYAKPPCNCRSVASEPLLLWRRMIPKPANRLAGCQVLLGFSFPKLVSGQVWSKPHMWPDDWNFCFLPYIDQLTMRTKPTSQKEQRILTYSDPTPQLPTLWRPCPLWWSVWLWLWTSDPAGSPRVRQLHRNNGNATRRSRWGQRDLGGKARPCKAGGFIEVAWAWDGCLPQIWCHMQLFDAFCLSQTNINCSCRNITPMGPWKPTSGFLGCWPSKAAQNLRAFDHSADITSTVLIRVTGDSGVIRGNHWAARPNECKRCSRDYYPEIFTASIRGSFHWAYTHQETTYYNKISTKFSTPQGPSTDDQVTVATIFRRQVSLEAPGKVRKVPVDVVVSSSRCVPVPAFSRLGHQQQPITKQGAENWET